MVTHGSQVANQEFQPLGTGSSLQWNLWFRVPTFGNRQFLAMNQTQTFRYRSIKQNHKIVKKLFSYHFNMHLFRAKTFLCRPNSQTQTFRYRSIKQNKRFCYRPSKQNKTTLRTMSPNLLQSTDPSTGKVTFSGLEP